MASSTTTQNAANGNTSLILGSTQGASLNLGPEPSPWASINRDTTGASIVVVMGVSGTGKSTLGTALADVLHLPFIDGDDLHPAANVAKMSRGEPLDDADRRPWLERIRESAVECVAEQVDERAGTGPRTERGFADALEARRLGVIVACSALKRAYRAVLRGEGVEGSTSVPTHFVYLEGDRDMLMARMLSRQGHFMKAGMLESQLDTLESPEGEPGVVTVSVDMSTGEQVQRVLETLGWGSFSHYTYLLTRTTILDAHNMNHGGHEGHDMPAMCSMHMLWNTQIVDTCIVFPSWHIHSNAQFVLSFVALVGLSALYEYLRLFQRDVDAKINERVRQRAASPVSGRDTSPHERRENVGLLSGRRGRLAGVELPSQYRALRAVLYGASVLLGCFLMLVFMTYNAYLIFAVVAGAVIGHYFFSGFVEPDSKGMACH